MRRRVGIVVAWILMGTGVLKAQSVFLFDEDGMARIQLELSARGQEITGLCLMRKTDGVLRGSVVNEFGIKAFDFTYQPSKGKTKLSSVVSFLNKWYIRRTLQRDLSFLFRQTASCSRGYRTLEIDDDVVSLFNKRYKLTYRFRKWDETTE